MNKKLLALYISILASVFCIFTQTSSAQQFTKLTDTSNFACIKYPSGKFGVGKAAKDGYSPLNFSAASKQIATKLSDKRERMKNYGMSLRELLKDNDITKGQLQTVIEDGGALGVTPKLAEKILKLNLGINTVKGEIDLISNELKALKDCQNGKTEFKAVVIPTPARILTQSSTTIILSSVLEISYPGSYKNDFNAFYCIKKDTDQSFRFTKAYKDACSLDALGLTSGDFKSCVAPSGKLYLPLVYLSTSITTSQDSLSSMQAELDSDYAGSYTLLGISDDPNDPCGYTRK